MMPVAIQKAGREKNLSERKWWYALYADCTDIPTDNTIIPVIWKRKSHELLYNAAVPLYYTINVSQSHLPRTENSPTPNYILQS